MYCLPYFVVDNEKRLDSDVLKMLYLIGPDGPVNLSFENFHKNSVDDNGTFPWIQDKNLRELSVLDP